MEQPVTCKLGNMYKVDQRPKHHIRCLSTWRMVVGIQGLDCQGQAACLLATHRYLKECCYSYFAAFPRSAKLELYFAYDLSTFETSI